MNKSLCENLYDGNDLDCENLYDCCDCGGVDCGCAYCWSCNACEACLNE